MPFKNKEKRKEYYKEYDLKRKDERNEYNKEYYLKHKEEIKENSKRGHFLYKYNLTLEQREKMKLEQNNKCVGCGEVKKLYVDHCHDTGIIRGLLCPSCNLALGLVKDDPLRLLALYQYRIGITTI